MRLLQLDEEGCGVSVHLSLPFLAAVQTILLCIIAWKVHKKVTAVLTSGLLFSLTLLCEELLIFDSLHWTKLHPSLFRAMSLSNFITLSSLAFFAYSSIGKLALPMFACSLLSSLCVGLSTVASTAQCNIPSVGPGWPIAILVIETIRSYDIYWRSVKFLTQEKSLFCFFMAIPFILLPRVATAVSTIQFIVVSTPDSCLGPIWRTSQYDDLSNALLRLQLPCLDFPLWALLAITTLPGFIPYRITRARSRTTPQHGVTPPKSKWDLVTIFIFEAFFATVGGAGVSGILWGYRTSPLALYSCIGALAVLVVMLLVSWWRITFPYRGGAFGLQPNARVQQHDAQLDAVVGIPFPSAGELPRPADFPSLPGSPQPAVPDTNQSQTAIVLYNDIPVGENLPVQDNELNELNIIDPLPFVLPPQQNVDDAVPRQDNNSPPTDVVAQPVEDPTNTDNPECCPICHEDFSPENGEIEFTRLCIHKFHQECLAQWRTRGGFCPLCRTAL